MKHDPSNLGRMSMHVTEYDDCCTGDCNQGRTCPRRVVGYTATRLSLLLPLVAIAALFVAALIFAGGIF